MFPVFFKTPKRAIPTMTYYTTATANKPGYIRDYENNVDVAATSVALGSNNFTINAVMAAAAAGYNMGAHWTADADF
jgi:hypothetical protein